MSDMEETTRSWTTKDGETHTEKTDVAGTVTTTRSHQDKDGVTHSVTSTRERDSESSDSDRPYESESKIRYEWESSNGSGIDSAAWLGAMSGLLLGIIFAIWLLSECGILLFSEHGEKSFFQAVKEGTGEAASVVAGTAVSVGTAVIEAIRPNDEARSPVVEKKKSAEEVEAAHQRWLRRNDVSMERVIFPESHDGRAAIDEGCKAVQSKIEQVEKPAEDMRIKVASAPLIQAMNLQQFFPELDVSGAMRILVEVNANRELPAGADGWAMIPKPSKVAEDYHGALVKVVRLLEQQYGETFVNRWEGAYQNNDVRPIMRLRLTGKTARAIVALEAEWPGDFIFIPMQFGEKWRGYSISAAQTNFSRDEFALGPYEVAVVLLSSPKLIKQNGLNIKSAGCAYPYQAKARGGGQLLLFFRFYRDKEDAKVIFGEQINSQDSWLEIGLASGFIVK